MMNTEHETDVGQLRYNYLTRCANTMPNYYKRLMAPDITRPAMRAADARLFTSLSRLVRAGVARNSVRQLENFKRQAALTTAIGGAGVGGHERNCGTVYAAAVLKNWSRLRRNVTVLAPVDLTTSTAPMLALAVSTYEATRRARDECAARYLELDKREYTTSRGGKLLPFRPAKLPPAGALAPIPEILDPKSRKPIPAQRVLCSVVDHQVWHETYQAARSLDGDGEASSAYVAKREATRVVSVSQPEAGAYLDLAPDGTLYNKINTGDLEIALQRRFGLNIAAATATHDEQEAAGEEVDRLGDVLNNSGQLTTRHNGVLGATYRMVAAGATGAVLLGDKGSSEGPKNINAKHVYDMMELESDPAAGGNTIYEAKVISTLKKTFSTGHGPVSAFASIGDEFAFGSTEEEYRVKILGRKQRGRPDGPRRGWPPHLASAGARDVRATDSWVTGHAAAASGDYEQALKAGHRVVTAIVEDFGGITPSFRAHMRYLARRSGGKRRGVDRTKYGTLRISPRSFYTHHAQQISKAAALGAAKHLREQLTTVKQKIAHRYNFAYAAACGVRA